MDNQNPKDIMQQAISLLMAHADEDFVSKKDALEAGANLHNLMISIQEDNTPKKWVAYDSEECPKCGTRTAHVLTRSTEDNLIYDGEEARCFNCQHTGVVSVEDSECADVVWDDYTPKDNVPQGELYAANESEKKSVRDMFSDDDNMSLHDQGLETLIDLCPPDKYGEDFRCELLQNFIREMYYRMAELEAQNKILTEWFMSSGEKINQLEAKNKELREALERVRSMSCKVGIESNREIRFFITNVLAPNTKDNG